jgi:hypothetical protein
VNRLHKEGCLRPGWWGGWQCTHDGEKVASINLRSEGDRLHLTYRVRIGGGDWEDVAETVRIVRVPCRLAGARPYFKQAFEAECLADEAFAIRAERLLARIENPRQRRKFW